MNEHVHKVRILRSTCRTSTPDCPVSTLCRLRRRMSIVKDAYLGDTIVSVTSIVRRPWHRLSVDVLEDALVQSKLCQPDCWTDMSVDQLASLYDSEITTLLDELIPARTVTIRRRIPGSIAIAAKLSVRFVVLNDWLAAVAHLMPQLPGLPSDVNTMLFVDRNAKRSGAQRLKLRSHHRVSCGVLLMRFSDAAALHPVTISALVSFTSSFTTRLLECGQQQQTRHRRHSR